jgi:hypothetical protein
MKVVANGIVLNKIKTLDIFRLDLGMSLADPKTNELVVTDTFIYKYFTLTGKQILKFGNIGKLGFYQDYTLNEREYLIFNDEKFYTISYDRNEEKIQIDDHLVNIIKEIEESEGIKLTEKDEKRQKNTPDISLPKEQYIQEMVKKRKI